jgi:hypothetical protein
LIQDLHKLNRADKLGAVQILVSDLTLEEEFGFVPGAQYEIWSPYHSAEAAYLMCRCRALLGTGMFTGSCPDR